MGFFDLIIRKFGKKYEQLHSAAPQAARGEKHEEKQAVPPETSSAAQLRAHTADDRWVLVKPVVAEKATRLALSGQYVFVVARQASKGAIRDAVAQRYGVRPRAVSVQRYRGTKVRFGRVYGMTKGFKKAIVTLPKGKTIDVLQTGTA